MVGALARMHLNRSLLNPEAKKKLTRLDLNFLLITLSITYRPSHRIDSPGRRGQNFSSSLIKNGYV